MIKKYLIEVQKKVITYELLKNIFKVIIAIISTAIILLFLESLFYFSPKIKSYLILILLFIFLSHILKVVFLLYSIKSNNHKKYNWEYFSRLLGKANFPSKEDTVLNAFQLESQPQNNNQSQNLTESFIKSVLKKIQKTKDKTNLNIESLLNLKKITIYFLILSALFFGIFFEQNAAAFNRLIKYDIQFLAPKPFSLHSDTGSKHILGGEQISIKIKSKVENPDSIFLKLIPSQKSITKRDSLTLLFTGVSDSSGYYTFKLPKLYQDYNYFAFVNAKNFWESWGRVMSKVDTIYVTDRPRLESFQILIEPPKYTNLQNSKQDGNVASISAIYGSDIKINLKSNRMLKKSFIDINDSSVFLAVNKKSAFGGFKHLAKSKIKINLVDIRGITNRDPVPYFFDIITDQKPMMTILKPEKEIELGDNQIIPFLIDIQDDFGFKKLQVSYEIIRPQYLNIKPYVSMFNIEGIVKNKIIQNINSFWSLNALNLLPEDEVHFHFELEDNNIVSGPSKTISEKYIARVPSLADLYEDIEFKEEYISEEMDISLEEIKNLENKINEVQLELLKNDDTTWEQEQEIKALFDETKKELEKLENISKFVEDFLKKSDKHKLFDSGLMEKFDKLSQLVENLIPDDLKMKINDLNENLDKINFNTLKKSLEEIANNMNQLENDLDRYIDIFERLIAEQKMNEIQNKLEKIIKQQSHVDTELSILSETDNLVKSPLANEQQRINQNYTELNEVMSEAKTSIEPFSQGASKHLQNLLESSLNKETIKKLSDTFSEINSSDKNNAKKSSATSLDNLETVQNIMDEIKEKFQKENISEITKKLKKIMNDVLITSNQQENLIDKIRSSSNNSPKLKLYAPIQQILQDQLRQILSQAIALSKETFALPKLLNKKFGSVNSAMQNSKNDLVSRNINSSKKNQIKALKNLNEIAQIISDSIQKMESSGSGSGYEEFLEQMMKMSGEQQAINKEGMQLGLGTPSQSMESSIMSQMMKGQQKVQKSLQTLMNEMKQSGNNNFGDLNGIKNDIEKVMSDLKNNIYSNKTKTRQKNILSRMLDSQKSLIQRGERESRKSSSATSSIVFDGPGGLPSDLGQRKSMMIDAMNKSLNAGYKNEYKIMIKRYFNSMNDLEKVKNEENINEK